MKEHFMEYINNRENEGERRIRKMKKMNKKVRIILILILCFGMVFSNGTTNIQADEENVCMHHEEHTDDCGYQEDENGDVISPCEFVCDICDITEENNTTVEEEIETTTEEGVISEKDKEDTTNETATYIAETAVEGAEKVETVTESVENNALTAIVAGESKNFDTLSEAINAADANTTVTINKNLKGEADKGTAEAIEISKSLIIDLNGKTIDAGETAGVFTVTSTSPNNVITIKNGVLTGTSGASGAPLRVTGAGTVNFENLKIIENSTTGAGGGLYINTYKQSTTAIINITNCTFEKNTSGTHGGAIYAYGLSTKNPTTLNIKDSKFYDNKSNVVGKSTSNYGGAIYDNDGKYQVYINRNNPDEGVFGTYSDLSQSKIDSVDISNYMLGGGAYRWKDADGNYIPLNEMNETYRKAYQLNNDPSNASKKAAETTAEAAPNGGVWITGNSSTYGGGAIGTNGTVIIGKSNPEHINVDVNKKWEDNDYANTVENVNIWLFRTNVNTPVEFVGREEMYYYISSRADHVENGKASREWKKSVKFQDLPNKDTNGEDYEYFILEEYLLKEGVGTDSNITHVWAKTGREYKNIIDEIMGGTPYIWSDEPGAIYKSEVTKNTDTDFTVTNSPRINISVEKVWDDNDNQDGIRANAITVQLLQNGKPFGTPVILNQSNQWKINFSELPEYDENGVKYQYAIEEVEVEGYDSVITNDGQGRFTITNTHEPEKHK